MDPWGLQEMIYLLTSECMWGAGGEGAEFESNCNSDQLFSIHFTHKFSLYILSETFQPKVLAGFQTVNIDSFSVQPQTLS